jgi:mitogen-activated protein kinase kinase
MLEHPWMVEMKGKQVNMERFLQLVWDWNDEVPALATRLAATGLQ